MNKWDHIQRFASEGVEIFWLPSGSKKATLSDWPNKATRDTSRLAKWFAPGGTHASDNWAAKAGAERKNPTTGETERLTILDIDCKNGKDGWQTLKAACEGAGLNLDDYDTLTVSTPSGGHHLYFWSARPVAQGVDVLGTGSGVDVRSGNGYVVGPGSVIDGKSYGIALDAPIASMGELATLFKGVNTAQKKADTTPLEGIDPKRAEARAIEYLKTAPQSIKGSAGDQTAYRVAATLKDFGCTEAQTRDLMLSEHWYNGCGWSAERLAEKVAHAFRYGLDQQGSLAAEAVFSRAPATDADAAMNPIDALNREYAFVLLGGKDAILWETHDADGRPSVEFLAVEAFHRKHAAEVLQIGKRSEPLTQAWMSSPKRRSYQAVVFKPGKDLAPQFFNLWKGFAVQPAAGDWSLMRCHIRDVICSGDPALDRYVMGWLARAVQLPGTRGEVALVLRGGRGVGKGTLGEYLCRMFCHHGVHISNAKHLIGNFNAHLRATVFLFADEAFWAGDRQHEGVLKALVTERQITIEAKGRDAVNSDNCLHILMASNDAWVVPSAAEERRFCVIDVSESRQQQNKEWFGPLRRQMDNGGLAAMLHDLLAHDLKGFDVYDIPQTKGLGDQKLHSLRGPERWLHDVLTDGSINGMYTWQGHKELAVPKSEAYAHYCERSRRLYGEHHPVDDRWFWKVIRTALAKGGAPLEDVRSGVPQVRKAVFPELSECRRAFSTYLKTAIEWGDEASIFD